MPPTDDPVDNLIAEAGGLPSAQHADVPAALRLAAALTGRTPLPGQGQTRTRWAVLTRLAGHDLTLARVVEAHLDAVAILAEAGTRDLIAEGSTWGVFAAEGGTVPLRASVDGGWHLDGSKPWCSLAGRLSHALVSAHVGDARRLFAVRLDHPGVHASDGVWHSRGLADLPSGPVAFATVPAEPVGEAGWYLTRPGFAYGGIGVAACWYGGALALGRSLHASARRRNPDQIAALHLGEADLDLLVAQETLSQAAEQVDAGAAQGRAGELLALRVRSVVAAAAERMLVRVGHALGPSPLALDEAHARRVADLTVYLRQHHAERDLARLGALLLETEAAPW